MSDIVIRPAHPDEWEEAGRITVAAYLADGYIDSHAGGYADQLANASTRATEAELLVAVDGDAVLGTVTVVHPDTPWSEVSKPGELEFRMLAVAPAARGRGVGKRLVQAVLAEAKSHHIATVVMSSSEKMTTAHRLYTRMGFHRLPERDWRPIPNLPLLAFAFSLELEV
jgi:ribosomal protein S18 acetylase RimI-like enzyme